MSKPEFEPIEISATMAGPVSIQRTLAIDSILAYAVVLRDGIELAMSAADCIPIEIPLQREPDERFHLASFAFTEFDCHEVSHIIKRQPIDQLQALSTSNTINSQAGVNKCYRIPVAYSHCRKLRWWALGDRKAVTELLRLITHLGKKRGHGKGKVHCWSVRPCKAWKGFPIVFDGKPLRALPLDWPGLDDPSIVQSTLTYPYWDHTKEMLVAFPEPGSLAPAC